jgi:hypothetical protein
MLKLAFLTMPPINPPTLSQLVSKLFSSCFHCILLFFSFLKTVKKRYFFHCFSTKLEAM